MENQDQKIDVSESVELQPEEATAVSGGGWLNVNVPLNTTEGKGNAAPVVIKPEVGFPRLDENS